MAIIDPLILGTFAIASNVVWCGIVLRQSDKHYLRRQANMDLRNTVYVLQQQLRIARAERDMAIKAKPLDETMAELDDALSRLGFKKPQ